MSSCSVVQLEDVSSKGFGLSKHEQNWDLPRSRASLNAQELTKFGTDVLVADKIDGNGIGIEHTGGNHVPIRREVSDIVGLTNHAITLVSTVQVIVLTVGNNCVDIRSHIRNALIKADCCIQWVSNS